MLEMKHRPPTTRKGLIRRMGVLERLRESSEVPVISVIAPPGYGKTTVLSQFFEEQTGFSAWLTLDEADSEPIVLLADLTEALEGAGLIEGEGLPPIGSGSVLTRGIRALVEHIPADKSGVLFLDQVDHLQTRASLDVVGAVMTKIAGQVQVIAASRSGSGLPLGLLRSLGSIVELDASDLAMDESEAIQVLEAMGVDRGVDSGGLIRKTEGWPAGIYLTALATTTGGITLEEVEIGGDDIFLADYLRDELLGETGPEVREFLMRTSLLPRLSGSLCDYVLEKTQSHQALSSLEQMNLMVVPLDRTRTWYRYHSLLKDFLRAEMERHHPKEIPRIHTRAAEWFDSNGLGDLAIGQAMEANDLRQFLELFARHARRIGSEGRLETMIDWVAWLEDATSLSDYGEFAALAAYIRSMEGNPGAAEHMSRYAHYNSEGAAKGSDELGPLALLMRSMQLHKGPDQALSDARTSIALIGTDSQWLDLAGTAEGMATIAATGLETSEQTWIQVQVWGEAIGAPPTISLALAQRSLIAIARDDWEAASEFSDRALDWIEQVDFSGYVSSGLVFAAAARCAGREGKIDVSLAHLSAASQLRPRLSSAFPAVAVQTLHEMARAFIQVADVAGARRVMRDAADIIAIRPKLGTLISENLELKNRLAELPAGKVGPTSLTSAELRLLPMLVTHLTYPEIGDRLFISRHTVKSQAMSIYRKLGVSSRAEAVDSAREIGLLTL